MARNITEVLAKLKIPVKLFGAIGNDLFGENILDILKKHDVDDSYIIKSDHYKTGTYISILSKNNDLLYGFSSMDIMKLINIEYIQSISKYILHSEYVIIDANVLDGNLLYVVDLLNIHNMKYILDVVSIDKLNNINTVYNNIHCIKVNLLEYEEFFNISIDKIDKLNEFSKIQFNQIIVSLGEDGVIFYDYINKELFHEKPIYTDMILNSNGAGDSLIGGFVYGLYNNLSYIESLRYGVICSKLSLESQNTISDFINISNLNSIYKECYH